MPQSLFMILTYHIFPVRGSSKNDHRISFFASSPHIVDRSNRQPYTSRYTHRCTTPSGGEGGQRVKSLSVSDLGDSGVVVPPGPPFFNKIDVPNQHCRIATICADASGIKKQHKFFIMQQNDARFGSDFSSCAAKKTQISLFSKRGLATEFDSLRPGNCHHSGIGAESRSILTELRRSIAPADCRFLDRLLWSPNPWPFPAFCRKEFHPLRFERR